jgi:hypothetical protein
MGISFNEDHGVRLYWLIRTATYLRSGDRCVQSIGGMAINNRKLKYVEKDLPQYQCLQHKFFVDYSEIKPTYL